MTDEQLPDSVPDEALVERIAAGDRAAFTTLFRRRQADVYRVALLMTGLPASAEDITQDVFMAVMHDAARFEPVRGAVKAWLCGIARNHARRRLERDGRHASLADDDERGRPDVGSQSDPVADLARTQQVRALRQAILSLPLRYREVVVLCDLEEISYAEAAAVIGCAIGTVRSRLHRARTLLAAKVRIQLARPDVTPQKRVPGCLA
jgi:RNA polymerase sigma-70 factor, ECF subfamily